MKEKILQILKVKLRASIDEDHEPFVYGHEEALEIIMEEINETIQEIEKLKTERDQAVKELSDLKRIGYINLHPF